MTREEFEDWLHDHKDDALDDCVQNDAPLPKWIARLATALTDAAREEEEDAAADDDSFESEEDDDEEEEEEEEDRSEEEL